MLSEKWEEMAGGGGDCRQLVFIVLESKSSCKNIFPPDMNHYVLKYHSFNVSINGIMYLTLLANFLFLILSAS